MRRWNQIFSLALMGLVTATGLLGGCNSDPSAAVDQFFKDMAPPKPGEAARQAFNVYDPDQRRRSVNLLSNASFGGEPPYLKTYRLLVDDPDATVRSAALRAIGRHGSAQDAPHVATYLKDPNVFVRWEAAMALQRLHEPKTIDPLVAAMRDDEDADVRSASAAALGQYAELRVFQALVGALNDDDYTVVERAEHSLEMLTGQDFGQEGSKWIVWGDKAARPFGGQLHYTWMEYIRSPTWLDKMQFWKTRKVAIAQEPHGPEAAAAPGVAPVINPVAAPKPQPEIAPADTSQKPAPKPANPPAADDAKK
jgi:hypothetical protein